MGSVSDTQMVDMSIQVEIGRERDCKVPDKTYWVPIPIQRVNNTNEAKKESVNHKNIEIDVRTPAEVKMRNKVNNVKIETHTKKPASNAPEKDKLKVLDYTSIFPRKRRSDLYEEIESRKFLDK